VHRARGAAQEVQRLPAPAAPARGGVARGGAKLLQERARAGRRLGRSGTGSRNSRHCRSGSRRGVSGERRELSAPVNERPQRGRSADADAICVRKGGPVRVAAARTLPKANNRQRVAGADA